MGYKTVALSNGDSKREFAIKLGAHEYINTIKEDPVKRLQEMGGADIICATAPNPKAISPLVAGLAPGGKLLVLAAAGQIEFDTIAMINGCLSVHGWASGHALDSEEAIAFAQNHGIKCLVEKFSLNDVNKGLEHMLSGKARFRAVLVLE
jgi:D-arabinose 1-dehydrogenase-like Zn-dependent alcohol dehydrogenase